MIAYENGVYFAVREQREQQDLNGDGDQDDAVLHRYSLATHSLENLAIATLNNMVVNQVGPQLSG